MTLFKQLQATWQLWTIGYRLMKLIEAPYGDLVQIDHLSRVVNTASTLQPVADYLAQTEAGRRALSEQPRLGIVNLEELIQLPTHTLGYAYADFMLQRGLKPPVILIDHPHPLVFLSVHMGEIHDIWHVVTGCDTSLLGEMKLQAFSAAQLRVSGFWVFLLAKNLIKTAIEDVQSFEARMDAVVEGWLLGKQANLLFGIDWKTQWEMPLETLRSQLGIFVETEKAIVKL